MHRLVKKLPRKSERDRRNNTRAKKNESKRLERPAQKTFWWVWGVAMIRKWIDTRKPVTRICSRPWKIRKWRGCGGKMPSGIGGKRSLTPVRGETQTGKCWPNRKQVVLIKLGRKNKRGRAPVQQKQCGKVWKRVPMQNFTGQRSIANQRVTLTTNPMWGASGNEGGFKRKEGHQNDGRNVVGVTNRRFFRQGGVWVRSDQKITWVEEKPVLKSLQRPGWERGKTRIQTR